jgi:hypothetical protein
MTRTLSGPGLALAILVCAACRHHGHAREDTGYRPVPAPLEAAVTARNGTPLLTVGGRTVPPFLFFFNTDVGNDRKAEFQESQIRLAAAAGVHLYSLPFRTPMGPDGVTPAWDFCDGLLDGFLEVDPEARFILRLFPGPDWTWKDWQPWREVRTDELTRYADGSLGNVSAASRYLWEDGDRVMARIISRYENSRYADRIIGYHPGAPNSELFHDYYRARGPDYSPANHRRFRAWLRDEYGSDQALQRAWGRDDVTLETAAVPAFEPGRFPMKGASEADLTRVFYSVPGERDWIDFSRYSNELVAEHVVKWARLIRRETRNRKLSVFFYGYTFELPGSFSGHYALQRVLACPEVDVLVSPYSYVDRAVGGTGNFMPPVDSVALHGKLWLNEDDTRTSLMDLTRVTNRTFLLGGMARNLTETLGILDRNFAAEFTHRAGAWWMDLSATGTFNHPAVWDLARQRLDLYRDLAREPVGFAPDVAVVVDETSKQYVRDDWTVNQLSMYTVRDSSLRTAASVGYYTLDDVISGKAPPAEVYVFANAWYLSDVRVRALKARLRRENAVALWCYAPAYLGPGGPDSDRVLDLTGVGVGNLPGPLLAVGRGELEGLSWGSNHRMDPRLVAVDDPDLEILATYAGDGAAAAARTRTPGFTSVFLGSLGATPALLRRLFGEAGVHLWCGSEAVVHCDGRVLAVHAEAPEQLRLTPPAGIRLEPIPGQENTVHTHWYRLRPVAGD